MARWLNVPRSFTHLLDEPRMAQRSLAEGLNGYARCREGQRGWTYSSIEALDKRIVLSEDPPPAGIACPACLLLWADEIVTDEELDEALARGYRVGGPASPPEHLERTG